MISAVSRLLSTDAAVLLYKLKKKVRNKRLYAGKFLIYFHGKVTLYGPDHPNPTLCAVT